ncbi:MAG TPA: cyclopropane fatty acyl phospholipid synthase [Acidobacteriaceae bacterium]|jgi:cyclopropane-fatty-acyl-phospholipid synthase|nr:cyclopropane fatty acyl phospholipid synthase [Acidobacteriaceae bacterium]
MGAEAWFRSLFEPAGIAVNGDRPFDLRVHNPRLYRQVRRLGTLGLGDAYVEGWWDCERVDELFCRLLSSDIQNRAGVFLPQMLGVARARLSNMQSIRRAFHVGKHHYDLGNELFEAMLGPTMAYSCGYWKDAATLDEAEEAKYDLACRKVRLKPGMTVLEIGCGWGGFARYAAERYGVRVVGLTVSAEQARYAEDLCRGLPVEIRLEDYRSFKGGVDAIVSIGMFEHVGVKNYATYFEVARRALKDDGLFLLHTIGSLDSKVSIDPWIGAHIFPNGVLPSLQQIGRATEERFVVEDVHNFGAFYERTLKAWHGNFHAALDAGRLPAKYDDGFRRMWDYYLLSCAGAFRARHLQLYQIALSPQGVRGGYCSVR